MDYKTMNSFLLLSVFVLVVLLYLINKRRENFEDHNNTIMNSSMEASNTNDTQSSNNAQSNSNNQSSNASNSTEETEDVNEFDVSIESMFKNLEKAEQYCDDMETRQSLREREERQKIQDIAKQQFEIQQRKIRELKRVVEHLKKQQKFKTDLRNKCQASTQYKLNKDTKTAKILAEGGLLDKQKTTLEVNVSDKLKELIDGQPKFDRTKAQNNVKEGFTNQNDEYKTAPPRYSYDACPSVDTDKYVHISQLANKCYGCNPYALIEHSNYIRKDFQ